MKLPVSESSKTKAIQSGDAERGESAPLSQGHLDQLDWQILFHLAPDARKPFLSIAAELEVDEKTIRNRVARLKDAGALQFSVLLSPDKIKKCIVIHVGLRLKSECKSQRAQLAEKLALFDGINWVNVVLGSYDLIAEAIFASFEEMKNFEINILPKFTEVESSDCFLALSHHGLAGVAVSDVHASKNI